MSRKKVVLAFSGGLDTSYCVRYLSTEKNMEVHSVLVDCGGFTRYELKQIEITAKELGVTSHKTIDAAATFYEKCIRFLVFGNVLKNHTYPLSVSAERVFQAIETVNYAQQISAQALAHGSTGAGNDQVRFDLIFAIVAPQMEIITPIRDQKLSRDEEIAYLTKAGIKRNWDKAVYSINQGLWGTSIGGIETLTSDQPLPEGAYPTLVTKEQPQTVSLGFSEGELKAVDGEEFETPVEAIRFLNRLAAPFGIGRDIHVGDTIIGIKGRVAFEAAAPMLIIKAHQTLEKHVLSKWQMYWKDQLADWYGMLLHEGQFLEPLMRNIEQFLVATQEKVTGNVFVRLERKHFEINGIESQFDLMNSDFGDYGEVNKAWSGEDVRGFARMLANSNKIYRSVNGD